MSSHEPIWLCAQKLAPHLQLLQLVGQPPNFTLCLRLQHLQGRCQYRDAASVLQNTQHTRA
jgi:hypothetical protein